MYSLIITSPFIEHPITDITAYDAHEFDISIIEQTQSPNFLNKGIFHLKQYCTCVLHKVLTLNKSQIKPFIQYQCHKMQDPIRWLNKLEKLIDLNRELFNEAEHKIKFEKALVIIELLRENIETHNKPDARVYDFNDVKLKLAGYKTFEEKLSFLYEVDTEYKQQPSPSHTSEVNFEDKIALEMQKLHKLEQLKQATLQHTTQSNDLLHIATHKSPFATTTTTHSTLQLNCNLNYFVDIFFQLAVEQKLLHGSLKELTHYIAKGIKDKDGHPISEDSVYSMLKPSNTTKRPKGTARYGLSKPL